MKSSVKDYLKIYGVMLITIIVLGVAVGFKRDSVDTENKYVLVDIIKVGDDKEPSEFYVYRNIDDGSFEFESVEVE